jgi:diadenosine tetraphosphate (Ap4A) HIT family hydrolase
VLFLKEHCEHLADLSPDRQVAIFRDVMNVAAAVRALFAPQRINYECLGNQLSHVHWHVIPRYQRPVDPDPGQVVWLRPAAELSAPLERGHAAMLVERLRAGLSPVNRR